MNKGPIYNVELLDSLPLSIPPREGGMMQALPSMRDLEQVEPINQRVVAGYEVLLAHYYHVCRERDHYRDMYNAIPSPTE